MIERREHLIRGVCQHIQIDPTILRNENIRLELKRGKYYYLRYWHLGVYKSKYVPSKLVSILEELIRVKRKIEIIELELERVDSELRRIKDNLELLLWGLNDVIKRVEE